MESRIRVWEVPDRMDKAFDDPGTSKISIRFCEMDEKFKPDNGKRRYNVVIRYPEVEAPIPKGLVFKSWDGVVNSVTRRINGANKPKSDRPTVFRQLAERLRDELGLAINPEDIKRTYASKQMLAAGASSWEATIDGKYTVYSSWPAGECVKKSNCLELIRGKWAHEAEVVVEPKPKERPPRPIGHWKTALAEFISSQYSAVGAMGDEDELIEACAIAGLDADDLRELGLHDVAKAMEEYDARDDEEEEET